VYWTPVWKILSEGDFTLIVANAAHIKQVPGRTLHLQQWDALDAAIRQIDRQIAWYIERIDEEAKDAPSSFRELILRLSAIPGVSRSATAILAEIGRDMSRFPTAGHLVAWAGLWMRACRSLSFSSSPCP
jgi:transposase